MHSTLVFHRSLTTQSLPSSFSLWLENKVQEAIERKHYLTVSLVKMSVLLWRCHLEMFAKWHILRIPLGEVASVWNWLVTITASLQHACFPYNCKGSHPNSSTDGMFVKAKHWDQPKCPSSVERVKRSRVYFIHTMKWNATEQWKCSNTPHYDVHEFHKYKVE